MRMPALLSTIALAMLMAAAIPATPADARQYGKSHHFRLDDIFFQKVHLALANEQDLDLSDEQVEALKTLKRETTKSIIRQTAEIEVLEVDIMSSLWQDEIDIVQLHKLIDDKYTVKTTKSKTAAEAYVQFKKILSEKQADKLREVWREQRYGHSSSKREG